MTEGVGHGRGTGRSHRDWPPLDDRIFVRALAVGYHRHLLAEYRYVSLTLLSLFSHRSERATSVLVQPKIERLGGILEQALEGWRLD